MHNMKAIKGLLLAGLIGTSGILTGCGGGGGAATPSYWTIDVRADATALPINIAHEGPNIGGRYTTTLYVEVKDSAGRPIPGGEDIVGCSYVGGLDSGPLYYLDGDPDHETTETIDGVEITTPNAYRAVTLSPNAGLATFHFLASDVAGPATVRCSVTDAGNVVRSDEVTIQVGSNTPSGKVSQVVFDSSSPNYLFVQGYNGPTQLQVQVNVVDEAGQPIVNFPAGVNNLQLRIVPDPASLADDGATLRGVDAYGQAVAGTSILVRSTNGQAQFTLVSGNAAGMILIEAISDRADNDVGNGVTEAIYNHVAVSAVTSAPTQAPTTTPLAISTTNPPAATANIPYGTLLEATGGSAPYTWSLVTPGALPTGLSLNTSGVISGTPFGGTAGTYNFVVQVRDAQGTTLQKSMAISYTAPTPVPPAETAPTITTTSLSSGKVGVPYITVVTATGGTPPYDWSAVGLPTGLSMTTTGVISGTPSTPCIPGVPAGTLPTCQVALTATSGSLYSTRLVVLQVNP
ncbi:MAG: Ig domain-containing protein [Thiobacillus sp.]